MNFRFELGFLFLVAFVALFAICGSATATPVQTQAETAIRLPLIVLDGNLAKIFEISDCEYISGLTCRIRYNRSLPLPSRVFFRETDERGKTSDARVQLICPALKAGETERATFRIRSAAPTKITLDGEWNGPWQSPY
jgi:hypothetical protein